MNRFLHSFWVRLYWKMLLKRKSLCLNRLVSAPRQCWYIAQWRCPVGCCVGKHCGEVGRPAGKAATAFRPASSAGGPLMEATRLACLVPISPPTAPRRLHSELNLACKLGSDNPRGDAFIVILWWRFICGGKELPLRLLSRLGILDEDAGRLSDKTATWLDPIYS